MHVGLTGRAVFWAVFLMAVSLALWAAQVRIQRIQGEQARAEAAASERANVYIRTMRRR